MLVRLHVHLSQVTSVSLRGFPAPACWQLNRERIYPVEGRGAAAAHLRRFSAIFGTPKCFFGTPKCFFGTPKMFFWYSKMEAGPCNVNICDFWILKFVLFLKLFFGFLGGEAGWFFRNLFFEINYFLDFWNLWKSRPDSWVEKITVFENSNLEFLGFWKKVAQLAGSRKSAFQKKTYNFKKMNLKKTTQLAGRLSRRNRRKSSQMRGGRSAAETGF